jgi:hypothetical protein
LYSPRAGHTILHPHTQVSREEVKEETVWKYIYDLLKIIGSIVVPFPVCTFTFFFWQKLFCEMLGHRKKYKKKRENNKKIKECEALNCVCVVCVCMRAADRETRPTTRAATSTLLLSVDGKQIY